ncbi:MAG: rhomboid family intramembrane serine protease, partial [Planctomycetes bacterium]|nr:rhomboid family intramembrane serine protease [Planctomycetota bacterium]
MPSAAPEVRRLLILWVAAWLVYSLSGLVGSGGGLEPLLLMDYRALFAGRLEYLPGLVGHAFGHEAFPALGHIFFNGLLLWIFGPEVEALYRGRRFWKLFLAAVAAGAGVHLLLHLVVGGPFSIPVIGGSGFVSAVIAINAAVYPGRVLSFFGVFRFRMMTLFLVYLVLDLMGFLFALAFLIGGVAVDSHPSRAAPHWLWGWRFQRCCCPLGRLATGAGGWRPWSPCAVEPP